MQTARPQLRFLRDVPRQTHPRPENIRYLRHPPLQLSQTRRRPSFRPQRLSRMRPHRAPRQELCSEGQISQTDEATSRRQWEPRNNKQGDPGRPFGIYSFLPLRRFTNTEAQCVYLLP